MTNPLVSLSHARKSFGKTEVLKDISLSVEQGQVVAIIGLPVAANPRFCVA